MPGNAKGRSPVLGRCRWLTDSIQRPDDLVTSPRDRDLSISSVAEIPWPKVAALFESGRSTRDCWCQWFRRRPGDFDGSTVDDRRAALHDRIAEPPAPGLVASADGRAVGWLSHGPVGEFRPRLERWSVAPTD